MRESLAGESETPLATPFQDSSLAKNMSLRVLHVLDHSWPVHTGYSIRSLHLIAAQHRLGLRPQALTGPLQIVDDPQPVETVAENVTYRRTPYRGRFAEWVISRRRPILREAAIVRLIRNRIFELVESEP